MQCPGQDSRYWEQSAVFDVNCPKCGHALEFFKDDSSRLCKNCGYRMMNPQMDFGCAEYCPYASQCLGSLPEGMKSSPEQILKDRVAVNMKRYFGTDFKRIKHAARVAHYAEEINKYEQADPAVVLISAYLHDIGIKESERKFGSSAPKYQHQEGPPIARKILTELKANSELIDEVCDIIGHHHTPREDETANFRVVYDADLIVNLEEEHKKSPKPKEHLEKIIKKSFLTPTGSKIAGEIFLN